MTDLTVIPKITLDEVADSIRDGFNKIDRSFSLFAEGTLQIGRALLIAKNLHPDNQSFGRWIGRNKFDRLDAHTRAALMNMARHEEISRQVLLETDRRSWRLLWEHEIQFKIPMERWPEPPPRKEPTTTENDSSRYGNAATTADSEPEPPKQAEVEILVGPGHFVPVSQLKPAESPEIPEDEEVNLFEEYSGTRTETQQERPEIQFNAPPANDFFRPARILVSTASSTLRSLNSEALEGRRRLHKDHRRSIEKFLDEVEDLIKEVEMLKSWFSKTGEGT
jgi:hypothetical protein